MNIRMLCRSKTFALCKQQPKIPSPECSTPMGERIYCHLHTDCFVASQLFSVARHVGRLKLGSKPAQIYVSLSISPISQQAYDVGLGNYKVCSNSRSSVRLFTFYTLPDTRLLKSYKEFCIMRAAAQNSFIKVLNPHGGAYILSSRDRLFRCIKKLQCGLSGRTHESTYTYKMHTISFQTFFVWALLLIINKWKSSPLRSNLLRLQFTWCNVPTTSGRPHGSPLCQHVTASLISSVVS